MMRKNKQAAVEYDKMIGAIIALVVLLVILGALIYKTFSGEQLPWIGGQNERVTQDCDEDNIFGIDDDCPCDKSIQKIEEGQSCGEHDSIATTNCPKLCKK